MAAKRKRSLIILLVVIIGISSWYFSEKSRSKKVKSKGVEYTVPFKKEGMLAFTNSEGDTIRQIEIEIADTEKQRAQGLMYRGTMTDDQGMLFIFDQEELQSFWMKNTYISLDIMYADSDGLIVSISRNTRPYSEAPIPSEGRAKYVIEVIAGFCDQYGVAEGDRFIYLQQ